MRPLTHHLARERNLDEAIARAINNGDVDLRAKLEHERSQVRRDVRRARRRAARR